MTSSKPLTLSLRHENLNLVKRISKLSMSSINRILPDCLLLEIFSYLNLREKVRYKSVSRQWFRLLDDWKLWEKINTKSEQHLYNCITDVIVKKWTLAWGEHILELYLDDCHWLTDNALCYIGETCPKLRALSLKGCKNVGDCGLQKLSQVCSNLRTINFHLTRVSDLGFNLLVTKNPRLEKLRLPKQGNCKKMLDAISQNCINVTELVLEDSIDETPVLDDDTLRQFTEKFPKLLKLYLSWCCHITDRSLESVANNCLELQSLHIKECPKITDDGIRSIAEKCRVLDDLYLRRQSEVKNACCYAIRDSLRHMTSLVLIDTRITDLGIEAIATNGENLRTLCFGENCFRPQNTKGKFLPMIVKHCSRLEKLHMYSVTMDDDALLRLGKNLVKLRDLHLGDCGQISKAGLKQFIEQCEKMTKLCMHNCRSFRDCHLYKIARKMTGLNHLEILGCRKVSEEAMAKFTKLIPGCLVKTGKKLQINKE